MAVYDYHDLCHRDRGHQQWTSRFQCPAVGGCVRWRFVDGCERAFLEMAALRFTGVHVLSICLAACLENVPKRKLDDSPWRYWTTRISSDSNSRQNLWQASRRSHLVVYSVDGSRNNNRFLVDPKRPETGDRLLGICHANVHYWFHVPQYGHEDLDRQVPPPTVSCLRSDMFFAFFRVLRGPPAAEVSKLPAKSAKSANDKVCFGQN